MGRVRAWRVMAVTVAMLGVGACAAAPPPRPEAAAPPAPAVAPVPAPVAVTPAPPPPPPLPEAFESEDFVVAFARSGDTASSLAARFLGDADRAWMVEDYNGRATFEAGQEVVVPRRPWNLSGVEPGGFQLVPVLCYHNLAPQARGRMVIAAKTFEEQMRYLKDQGYRVVSIRELLEFSTLRRQLPRKTVVLTFDDGWKAFKEYAYPVLKELGFTATLFIYTDFVGARSALSWDELRDLAKEGFDIQAHSKTHSDMRRKPGEPDDEFLRRLQAELVQPQTLFQRQLGGPRDILAYPYGAHSEEVVAKAREAGYVAAFDVRRQGNPSFGQRLTLHRSQIYSEMTLDEFARNLNVFNQEVIK
ncbi:MAG TPA: polysaccharide deacetylase family protein [Methylomirabilota bacterium]|nr:polysaccharide deacetylase family protein [Methylomirabilota bacterium]